MNVPDSLQGERPKAMDVSPWYGVYHQRNLTGVFSCDPQHDLGELSFSLWPERVRVTGQGARELGKLNSMKTPPLEAGTKPMGFPKGRSGSSPLWSNTGIQTPCSI